ncbi:unnamed protein product, partial [Symbiodinium sp. KB8]
MLRSVMPRLLKEVQHDRDVPPRVYSALGQEWRISWIEFRAVVRAWIGDPPAQTMLAITQAPETGAEQSRFGRLSETLRARSLSPGDGPLLGSRASFLDSATDANVIPSILLPYTFPAFQVGSALPLSLQARPTYLAKELSVGPLVELKYRPVQALTLAPIPIQTGTGERPWFSIGCRILLKRYATPPHLAQLHLWHLGKEILLPHLATLCQQLWQSPLDFHQFWADAWIAWLAKPGKAPDQPENLRPISLTEGGGRIVVKALTLQLRPSLTEATRSWPQYAYVPGRSIEHAIIRALHHCDRVHTAVAAQRITLQERRTTGRVPTACRGGVTLSIDTSKAFDTVDRSVLEHELKTARIPEPELTLIMSLHQNIGYWPAGPESDIRVSSERGVRQGCPLAPSLWTLVTVALLRAMAGTESLHWIQHDATMFADDLLLQWEYHSISELEHMISAIQHCFQILARLGLQVQHRKTQLLVAQNGRLAHKWWKAHTASTKEGRFLRIPQQGQKDLHLPIVPQLTYLGIVLSCTDAATATVEHRLQVAEAQRARLLKVLHSRTLPLRKRVQLWVACVRSSALYGLHLLDLKQKHVARITIVLVKHLRAIARSFAHMSQEASQALLLRLGVEDPLPFLLHAGQKLLTKTLQSQDPMVHQPRILQWLTHITEVSHDPSPLIPEVPRTAAAPLVDGAPVTAPVSGVPMQASRSADQAAAVLCDVLLLLTVKKWVTSYRRVSTVEHISPALISILVPMDHVAEQMELDAEASRRRGAADSGKSGTSSDQLLHKVAKALIVQSDYLSRLQSDHTVIFTFRNGDGPQLMVPLLHEVTANWRDQRSKGKVTKSLKQTLLQYVTSEIITRVSTFADDKNAQPKAQEMGWVTSDLEYNYLDWDAEEQRLVPRQEGTLTQVQVLADAKRLKTLLKEQELIIKFSAGPQCPTELSLGNSDVHLGALATDPSSGGGHGDFQEVVCLINPSAS